MTRHPPTNSTSTPTPTKRKKQIQKTPKLQQQRLDFGQARTLTTCADCGMTYQKTSENDRETHKKFCTQNNKRIAFLVIFFGYFRETRVSFKSESRDGKMNQ